MLPNYVGDFKVSSVPNHLGTFQKKKCCLKMYYNLVMIYWPGLYSLYWNSNICLYEKKKAALKSRLKVSSLKKAHTYLRRGISDHTKYINMSNQYIRVLQQGSQHLHVQNVTARGSVTAVLFCFLNLKCVFTY